jgi:hypothetical protein
LTHIEEITIPLLRGAGEDVRPKLMTASTAVFGLLVLPTIYPWFVKQVKAGGLEGREDVS